MQSSFVKELTFSIVIYIICGVIFGTALAFVTDKFPQLHIMAGKNSYFIPMVIVPMISALIVRQFLVQCIDDISFAISFFFCIIVLSIIFILVVGIELNDIKVVFGVFVSALVSAYILYKGDC